MGHRTGSRRAPRGPIAKDTVDEAEIVAALAMGVVLGGGEIRGSAQRGHGLWFCSRA